MTDEIVLVLISVVGLPLVLVMAFVYYVDPLDSRGAACKSTFDPP